MMFFSTSHATETTSSFDGEQKFSRDISHFPKWSGMMRRYAQEKNIPDAECGKRAMHTCNIIAWKEKLSQLRGKENDEQRKEINTYANGFPYTPDIDNWSKEDYWETPYEFHAMSGDCEDYAITKYYSLRAAGVSIDKMRIIIVQDLNLGGIIHAVLGVYEDDNLWLLDNQIKQVIAASKVYHYRPIYAINERGWWAYAQ